MEFKTVKGRIKVRKPESRRYCGEIFFRGIWMYKAKFKAKFTAVELAEITRYCVRLNRGEM